MDNLFHIKLYRRAILFMAAALLLAYAGLFQHQIMHHSGEADCAQCLTAHHFGLALPSVPSALSMPAITEPPLVTAIAESTSTSIRYFSARAPPSFL